MQITGRTRPRSKEAKQWRGRAGRLGGRVGRRASGRSGGVEVADLVRSFQGFLAMPPDLAVHAV